MKRLQDLTEPELSELLTRTARRIEGMAELLEVEKPQFVLLLFNDPAVGQYISNCQRSDVIKALRETADRLQAKEDLPR